MILKIAGWYIEIDCSTEVAQCFPNWEPFLVNDEIIPDNYLLCRIHTGVSLPVETSAPILTNQLEERLLSLWIYPSFCYIHIAFDGGRGYSLRADRDWRHVTIDWTFSDMLSCQALNDFLMISYVYSAAFHDTIMIHASSVVIDGEGCAFIGPSGVGKSTHSRLWLDHIPHARLLNDDQPILRRMPDGRVYIYGSPWSGKTFCYHNEGALLKSLFFMQQAVKNRAFRLSSLETFGRLLESVSAVIRDSRSFAGISDTLAYVAGNVPAYLLQNRPDKDAALMSARLMSCSD